MRIELPFTEALAIATVAGPLPAMIESIRSEGPVVYADVDLRAIPSPSAALRLAAAAAGPVSVTVRLAGYSDGTATLAVTAHARGLPAHKLLPFLLGPINGSLQQLGLPADLVQLGRGDPDNAVRIDLQRAIESKVGGVDLTELEFRDGVILAEVGLDAIRMR